jgi:chromosome segregation ATPase
MIIRVYEDMEDIKTRLNEKSTELNDCSVLRNEYENCIENLSKIIQVIETKSRQANAKLNLDLLKVNKYKSNSKKWTVFCLGFNC